MKTIVSAEESTQHTREDPWLLRVTDLKQFAYCPRIVFFDYYLPGVRSTTFKMQHGIEAQDRIETLEKRRSLREYGIAQGTRHFNVGLTSQDLGCTAQVDLVVEYDVDNKRTLLPVDFKMSRREPGHHFKLQLACYGMMLEELWHAPVPEGIIYLIPVKRAVRVALTARLRNDAKRMLANIRAMIDSERMPPPTPQRNRCVDCEVRRFCNDVF